MADTPDKLGDLVSKFNLQEIIGNVKSFLGSEVQIPAEMKDNPTGFHLSEITESLKKLQELKAAETKEIDKIGAALGSLCNILVTPKAGKKDSETAKEEKAEKPKKKTSEK
ncbi:MAG: hypothetical protein WCW01_04190 [Gammaproteobacteria bacterium]